MRKIKLLPILLLVVVAGTTYMLRGALPAFAASTYTVNSIGDDPDDNPGDDVCQTATPGECTFRAAIQEANAHAGNDTINFGISGTGLHTLTPASAYDPISEAVTINGYSQSGSVANTNAAPAALNGTLTIEIDGSGAGATSGIEAAAVVTIRGLVVNNFTGDGIALLVGSGGSTIAGNYIGINAAGTTDAGNTDDGVAVASAANTIGGTSAADRNLISGNDSDGVTFINAAADNNIVRGNIIGLNAAGSTARGNAFDGISEVVGVSGTIIGGTDSGAGNVSSGNGSDGIDLNGSGATIQGNYLGLGVNGTSDLGNTAFGAWLHGDNNTVGSTTSSGRNVMSGNDNSGIRLDGNNNTIVNNYVGTNATGTAAVGNVGEGIAFENANSNTVGGTTSSARNLVSGNGGNGISTSFTSSDNTIIGNYVGTDVTGASIISNTGYGVSLASGNATVGGTTNGARNVIAGNTGGGVTMADNVTVQGNYIGLNATGDTAFGNGTSQPNVNLFSASNCIIGGNTAAARNVIAGPNPRGIAVLGGTPFGGGPATNNKIQGNYIGTDPNGVTHAGFGADVGVLFVIDAQNNLLGGTGAGEGNLITGNGAGVGVSNLAIYEALNNSIVGNSIFNNSGWSVTSLGIDLLGSTNNGTTFTNAGVTANDAGDTDVLSNHLMNFPVLSAASSANGTASITYSLDINDAESGATGYRVEFFANDAADPSGNGEGQTYIGSDTVAGDVTNRSVNLTLPSGVSGAKFITATTTMTDASTDGFGHTSEFSANNIEVTLIPATTNGGGAGGGSDLANTGQNTQNYWIIAAALIAIGSFAGLKVLRRNATKTSSR